jgi:diphthamide biosynthesis enzyme Dph1/Dph2-like protein
MNYDLKLNKVVEEIKANNHKKILIQLADGLKPEAKTIVDEIKKQTNAEVLIYSGSCFGGCDLPLGINQLNVDLVVQFGHNRFIKKW